MKKLSRENLYSLEKYTEMRSDMRAEVMAYKKNRRLAIGPNITLYFEDLKTIQYQVQEMLRIEKIFDAEGIDEELSAYNPLIPDGTNLKATMMVEIPDPEVRSKELVKMVNIEHAVWLRVDGFDAVTAIADEDLDRTTEEKTSAVHFLRFEFSEAMIASLHEGALLNAGVEHEAYTHLVEPIEAHIRDSLVNDFD